MPFSEYDIECIRRAKELIDKDISRHYSIASLALKSNIGQTKLKQGFKQYIGVALFAYLRQQRMTEAANLLVSSAKSVKQIAKAIGFKHDTNFRKAFKKYHGSTPSFYRAKLKKQSANLSTGLKHHKQC